MAHVKNIIDTVYCDMDGVLSDLDSAASHLWHDVDGWQATHFPQFIRSKGFQYLKKTRDHDLLVNFLFEKKVKLEILSSAGGVSDELYPLLRDQKEIWLLAMGLGSLPVTVVRSKRYKANYATPTSLLIDDLASNCSEFIMTGGHAIQHTSAIDTIDKIYENFSIISS